MPQVTTDVRERIVNAAERCFARYGVGKTTVEDIAAAAGLSRATVYRSFAGGRDEVILAVLLRDMRRFLDRLAVRLGKESSVADGIVEGVVDAVAFVRREPRVAALLTPEAAGHTQTAVAGASESVLRLCADRVRPYFATAQRERLLRADITVEGTIEFLFRIISSLIALPRDGDPRDFLRTYVLPALVESE
ncbi:TetR/AcrR family transcriptional regulator [Actinoallomurus purpureus]|uniref:TetR/AcrR family transcriptional regulator n=1 Tax=Actinoallomurus purpureus TaxID=478114 RepID=UPI0020924E0D|nr:TetR/AcrR family transcriptional regulator [Actinoallomurus purpureus]MCO6006214.1 TetR/AcrR family transcriptional regulator [Actinoallomurus purpureus]